MSKLNPLAILLKNEGYPPAVLCSIAIHSGLLWFILGSNIESSDFVDVSTETYIDARTVQDNPQRLRRLEQIELQRQAQQAEERRREQARRQAEEEARAQAERERLDREAAEKERLARETQEREAREREAQAAREREEREARERAAALQAEQERQEAERLVREEAQRAAAEQAAQQAEALAAEEQLVAQYSTLMKRIITQNWLIPPNARNNMMVMLQISLVPTGEVIAVEILQSSGDSVFDRSAQQAVERIGRFYELQELDYSVFDRHFRTINLQFRPEDLLR